MIHIDKNQTGKLFDPYWKNCMGFRRVAGNGLS